MQWRHTSPEHTQQYRSKNTEMDGKEITVHYVRINRIVKQKAKRNRQQEDNIRSAELDFMLDLETMKKNGRRH